MHALWYSIMAVMLTIYVLLDGFDIGVGILHLYVARSDDERKQVFNAIGPFWSANEVWLIASGGLMIFAFPKVYSAGFSGFYLPLMMALWLFVGRGLSIEFRSKEVNQLWRTFWDTDFCASSLLLSIVFGAALGNVIRGVPLTEAGYFDGPLFTNFMPGNNPGVLDWYTVSVGLFAALTLAGHGALFLAYRTSNDLRLRSMRAARFIWPVILLMGGIVSYLTWIIRPEIYQSLLLRPWSWPLPVLILCSTSLIFWALLRELDLLAFGGSLGFIAGLLVATAAGMYPNMLISTIDSQFSLTSTNAASDVHSLQIGLCWWIPSVFLVMLYFSRMYRVFRGKIDLTG